MIWGGGGYTPFFGRGMILGNCCFADRKFLKNFYQRKCTFLEILSHPLEDFPE
jgi:hypothetical protein